MQAGKEERPQLGRFSLVNVVKSTLGAMLACSKAMNCSRSSSLLLLAGASSLLVAIVVIVVTVVVLLVWFGPDAQRRSGIESAPV